MISKDIEQLSKGRLILETEITQKEADIRIKKSEITSLQVHYFQIISILA